MICKGYERLLFPRLSASTERSMVVCPTSKDEVDAFVSVVLSGSNNDPADIAILDQNIDIINEKVYLAIHLFSSLLLNPRHVLFMF